MDPNKEIRIDEIGFTDRINAVFLRKTKISFEEVVRQYRQIEAEFVERERDNEVDVVEIKRRITEWLLTEADTTKQPHEVCRAIWDELTERGFSDPYQRYWMSGVYVRCCQRNGEFDAALAIHEPQIAEVEQWAADSKLKPDECEFWQRQIEIHNKIRDELKAGLRK